MTAWVTGTIGAVCNAYSGGTPSTSHPEYYGGAIPWIASADLNQGRISSVKGRITKLGLDRSSARLVSAGTPLIALYGATSGVPAITNVAGAINQAVLAMEPRGVDAEYLYQWLRSNRQDIIDRYTQGGQPNLSGAIVRSIALPLPSKDEQRRIAATLRIADNLIASLERLIAKKEAIKEGMMQQLLTGKSRLPGFSAPWRSMTLGALADQHRRAIDPRRDRARRFQHFSLPAFDEGERPVDERGSMIESMKFVVPQDAILVSKLNPRIPRVWAPPMIGADAIASTEFVVMTPKSRTDRSFLKWLIRSNEVMSHMKLLATGTTGSHSRIQPQQIAAIGVRSPVKPEQKAIAEALDDADRQMVVLRERLIKACAVKTGMMQELLTGRSRLPVAAGAT